MTDHVRCPICLSTVDWAQAETVTLDADGRPEPLVRLPGEDDVRWNHRRLDAYRLCAGGGGEPHVLPGRYGDFGEPLVIGVVGESAAGKSHLLAAMLGMLSDVDRMARLGLVVGGLDLKLHQRYLKDVVRPFLDQGLGLAGTPAQPPEFTDALWIHNSNTGRSFAVAFFDVSGEWLADHDAEVPFLGAVSALVFVVDPTRIRGLIAAARQCHRRSVLRCRPRQDRAAARGRRRPVPAAAGRRRDRQVRSAAPPREPRRPLVPERLARRGTAPRHRGGGERGRVRLPQLPGRPRLARAVRALRPLHPALRHGDRPQGRRGGRRPALPAREFRAPPHAQAHARPLRDVRGARPHRPRPGSCRMTTVDQILFGWAERDHEGNAGVRPVAHSGLRTIDRWAKRLQYVWATQDGQGDQPEAAASLVHLVFEDEAAVLRKLPSRNPHGRGGATLTHVLVGDPRAIDTRLALGLHDWPGWQDREPDGTRGALTPLDLAGLEQAARPGLAALREEAAGIPADQLTTLVARVLADPAEDFSVIARPQLALPMMTALYDIVGPVAGRPWTFARPGVHRQGQPSAPRGVPRRPPAPVDVHQPAAARRRRRTAARVGDRPLRRPAGRAVPGGRAPRPGADPPAPAADRRGRRGRLAAVGAGRGRPDRRPAARAGRLPRRRPAGAGRRARRPRVRTGRSRRGVETASRHGLAGRGTAPLAPPGTARGTPSRTAGPPGERGRGSRSGRRARRAGARDGRRGAPGPDGGRRLPAARTGRGPGPEPGRAPPAAGRGPAPRPARRHAGPRRPVRRQPGGRTAGLRRAPRRPLPSRRASRAAPPRRCRAEPGHRTAVVRPRAAARPGRPHRRCGDRAKETDCFRQLLIAAHGPAVDRAAARELVERAGVRAPLGLYAAALELAADDAAQQPIRYELSEQFLRDHGYAGPVTGSAAASAYGTRPHTPVTGGSAAHAPTTAPADRPRSAYPHPHTAWGHAVSAGSGRPAQWVDPDHPHWDTPAPAQRPAHGPGDPYSGSGPQTSPDDGSRRGLDRLGLDGVSLFFLSALVLILVGALGYVVLNSML
ncbi:hypothetical protein ACQ4WX_43085 [Streptomyces lasalocidi]